MDFNIIRLQNAEKIFNSSVKYKPRHESSNNVACATSKALDQPAQSDQIIC